MRRSSPWLPLTALAVGLALVAVACGDDGDAAPTTTAAQVRLGEPLAVGQTYEDPSGAVTLTVHGVRFLGGRLIVDAEACTRDDGPAGLPVQLAAWQLQVRGREQTLGASTVDDPPASARPPWPAVAAIAPGECLRAKVGFALPDGVQVRRLLFTQLAAPAAWTIRG